MRKYNLGFITDEDIFIHVKETVQRYSASINLKEFNKNNVDPIKLTFDAKVYGRTMEEVVASECIRQMDKSNNNHIGYFHQNLFRYAGNGWSVPKVGFDVVNEEKHIFALLIDDVLKLKESAINKINIKLLNKLMYDNKAICMVVNLSEFSIEEKPWIIDSDDGYYEKSLRYLSIKKFYEVVFGETDAYEQVANALPLILEEL